MLPAYNQIAFTVYHTITKVKQMRTWSEPRWMTAWKITGTVKINVTV